MCAHVWECVTILDKEKVINLRWSRRVMEGIGEGEGKIGIM